MGISNSGRVLNFPKNLRPGHSIRETTCSPSKAEAVEDVRGAPAR
jgi:hypothetical protein